MLLYLHNAINLKTENRLRQIKASAHDSPFGVCGHRFGHDNRKGRDDGSNCIACAFSNYNFFNRFLNDPRVGVYTIIILGFIAIGLTRYIRNVPFGLSVDGFIVLTYIAIFFRYFYEKINWSQINRDLVYLGLIWFSMPSCSFLTQKL